MTFSEVTSRLSGVKARGGDQAVARCPVHDDRTASLSVGRGDDGRVLLHCHAGCATDDVLAALGLIAADLFLETVAPLPPPVSVRLPTRPRPESPGATYDYTDLEGVLLHQVVRGTDKSFRQRRPNGKGGWTWRASGHHVPYRWPELSGQSAVWIVEGEKDCNALWAQSIPATTNAGGAGKFGPSEAAGLVEAGVTSVFVVPDNDIPGRNHADQVITACRAVGLTATLVVLDGLEPHGDVSDWLADPGHTPALLLARGTAAAADPSPRTASALSDVAPVLDFLSAPVTFEETSEGRYRLSFATLGVTFEVAHLRRERQRDLHGELKVRTTMLGARCVGDLLSSANLNFSSQQARQKLSTFLAGRSGAPQLDWLGAIEIVCARVTDAEESGAPILPLSSYELPRPTESWLAGGMPILQQHPMILFGDGGAAKSYIALHVAVTLAHRGIRVLYADWEFSGEDHRERLGRLAGADVPENIFYTRLAAPLVQESPRLAAFIHAESIDYIICDSVGFGVPGRPEDAEHATAYFRALRSLKIGSFLIAHTTKNAETNQQAPFGSAFWSNGARSIWHAKRGTGPAPDPRCVDVALTHKKASTGALLPARGLRFMFGAADTRVSTFDVATNPDLAGSLPIWQRLRSLVASGGGRTIKELALELDEKPESVARTVLRMNIFERDGEDRIHLAGARDAVVL